MIRSILFEGHRRITVGDYYNGRDIEKIELVETNTFKEWTFIASDEDGDPIVDVYARRVILVEYDKPKPRANKFGELTMMDGDEVICPHCGEEHPVELGTDSEGRASSALSFYKCDVVRKTYLVAVGGRYLKYIKIKRRDQ